MFNRFVVILFSFILFLQIPTWAQEPGSCFTVFSSQQTKNLSGYKEATIRKKWRVGLVFVIEANGRTRHVPVPKEYLKVIKGQKEVYVKINSSYNVIDVHVDNKKEYHGYARVQSIDPVTKKALLNFNFTGFPETTYVPTSDQLKVGDYIRIKAEPIVSKNQNEAFKVEIVENLGTYLPAKLDSDRIYKDMDIDVTYPEEVLAQAREILNSQNPTEFFKDGRLDLRNIEFITIDGPTTIDRDDAIHVEKLDNGFYKLLVAVPDLTYHIPIDSPISRHMLKNATSHYLGDHVWHLLPNELVSGALSIDPHTERAAIVFEMMISPEAKVKDFKVTSGVVKSRGAFTYEQVQKDFLAFKEGEETYFKEIYELYTLMLAKGHQYLSLPVSFEKSIKLDEHGEPKTFDDFKGLDANDLIEKFMILTNISGARWMVDKQIPGIFRGQELPDAENIAASFEKLAQLGVNVKFSARSNEYENLKVALQKIENSEYIKPAASLLLQSTTTAENVHYAMPHFFLNTKTYSFLTSPIRRSSDFWNQHVMMQYLKNGGSYFLSHRKMKELAEESATYQNEAMKKQKVSEIKWTQVKAMRFYGDLMGQEFSALYIDRENVKPFIYIMELDVMAELSTPVQDLEKVKLMKVKVIDQDLINGRLIVEAQD